MVLVALMSFIVAISAVDSAAQTAGSTVVSVSVSELREVVKGWVARRSRFSGRTS